MRTSIQFWLHCALWLYCGYGLISSAVIVVKRKLRKGKRVSGIILTTKEQVIEKIRSTASTTVKIGLGVILGVILGMEIRDRQLVNNRQTWTEIEVQKKFADRDFQIQPARMDTQHVQICPSSTVDWYRGERLDYWTFEQMQGCKRVINYHETPKGEENVSLQMR
jgi:hypothetical protein